MSDLTSVGVFVGSVCLAIGSLVSGLLMLWWTKGAKAQVMIIKAKGEVELKLQADDLIRKGIIIAELKEANAGLVARVAKAEADITDMRKQGHDDRNKWYLEQLKYQEVASEKHLLCQKEAALLKGKYEVLQHQFDKLHDRVYPTTQPSHQPLDGMAGPVEVKVINQPNQPVPTKDHAA